MGVELRQTDQGTQYVRIYLLEEWHGQLGITCGTIDAWLDVARDPHDEGRDP